MKIDDRMKLYERQYDAKALERLPLIVRVDGRAFHTYTKRAMKPFDFILHGMMQDTVKAIVEEFNACIGYTQSDEMSFLFYQHTPKSQLPFGGRINKINSVFASVATAHFVEARRKVGINSALPFTATFDCRCFVTPTREEAANYFLWREEDATRNAISMAAHWKFGHKKLDRKNTGQQQEMLFSEANINFNDYPSSFKRGSYLRRIVSKQKARDVVNIESLPLEHNFRKNPDLEVERSETVVLSNIPIFSKIINKVDFLFEDAEPMVQM